MVDQTRKTKTAILRELESIQGLLNENPSSPLDDDIPTLEEVVVEDANPGERTTPGATQKYRPEGRDMRALEEAAEALRREPDGEKPRATQPSLFESPGANGSPVLGRGRGENPFLPQHIRERLASNRPPRSNQQAPQAKPEPSPVPSRRQLIDELLDTFVPELTSGLRKRLEQLTDEQLQALLRQR